jgi:hypothetical protein
MVALLAMPCNRTREWLNSGYLKLEKNCTTAVDPAAEMVPEMLDLQFKSWMPNTAFGICFGSAFSRHFARNAHVQIACPCPRATRTQAKHLLLPIIFRLLTPHRLSPSPGAHRARGAPNPPAILPNTQHPSSLLYPQLTQQCPSKDSPESASVGPPSLTNFPLGNATPATASCIPLDAVYVALIYPTSLRPRPLTVLPLSAHSKI